MQKNEIMAPRSYVNLDARVVREVIEDVDGWRVKFNAFELDSGKLVGTPNQVCRKIALARWADREADPRELARLHPYGNPPGPEVPSAGLIPEEELERSKADIGQFPGNRSFNRW